MKSIRVLILVLLLVGPLPTYGAETPPKKNAGAARSSISIKALTCRQFLDLPDDIRPMVAGWVHGLYYRQGWNDAWMLDIERARRTMAALQEACKEASAASFRHKLGEVLKQDRK